MPVAIVHSRGLVGAHAPHVTVETHLANGLPCFNIVGLPDTEVKEARDRVRAALVTCGFEFPARRITVNLAPADLPKDSGRYDLPIAIGILAASGAIPTEPLANYEFVGELSLTGDLRSVRGALAMTFQAAASGRAFVLPQASAAEAALVPDARVLPARTLLEVCAHLSGGALLERSVAVALPDDVASRHDLADVRGQGAAKRALEVAAAGRHNLLLIGPPGTGKSMLAQRLNGVLPRMTDGEALEAAAIQSLGSAGFNIERWHQRPFRAPHHSASSAAIVGGGGGNPRPGEISLAHRGVLFLDEFTEFQRSVLESLREPLETGRIAISRAARQAEFPARFQLVAAMNPCACGYLGHPSGRCACTPTAIERYRSKLSGPLLDRIDMHVEVPSINDNELIDAPRGERSSAVSARVQLAHDRALDRQSTSNADLTVAEVARVCVPDRAAEQLLRHAIARLGLSARGYHRILKVARTIADLASAATIDARHVAEAVQYRRVFATPLT